MEQLADELVAAVERTLSQTGAAKVHLVGHSLGGVVIAQAIAGGGLVGLVDTVITLGSPFGGSPWAGLLPFGELLRALRPGSPLLRRLASAPVPDGVWWLAVTAALDIIVPGPRSVPTHADVETITVDGIGHLERLISRAAVWAGRRRPGEAARAGEDPYVEREIAASLTDEALAWAVGTWRKSATCDGCARCRFLRHHLRWRWHRHGGVMSIQVHRLVAWSDDSIKEV